MINETLDFTMESAKEAAEQMLETIFYDNPDISRGAVYAGVLAVILKNLREDAPTVEAMIGVVSLALAASTFDDEETDKFFC
jgi:hypothetical protein|tara:strand:- start:4510 stop:4755 length:246 start_codon:yes stop_codon:yes gene_type:complete